MAQAAMELVPPLIRDSLLEEREFREDFGFITEALIAFNSSGVSFQRSNLFESMRTVLDDAVTAEITDETGAVWHLNNEADESTTPILVLSAGDKRLNLSGFAVLSDDETFRIHSLEESATIVNLPTDAKENWVHILSDRALYDDEVDLFYNDIRDTPVHFDRSIRSEIAKGKSTISLLVPNSLRYFQRLVGTYDMSATITDYATGTGRKFFEQLSEWRPYEGFLYSLLLSSHSTLTAEINVDRLDKDNLVQAYEFVQEHGDMLSRLGALEVGLRILPERPEVQPFLLRIVNLIRDDNLEGNNSEFKLLSALYVLVEGELSRTRLMAGEPPFYRRLASLAQAALIHRQLIQVGIDYESFSNWAFSNRAEYYYMQSLADMRVEPRWDPELVYAPQMKADFFGRIMIAGKTVPENIGEGDLRETILGNGEQSLISLSEFPRPYYPGPLEGAEESPNELPHELASVIEEQLEADEIDASSFIALVNSAKIFRITSGHAELATKALRLGNYTLEKLEDKSQLVGILNGLATVAAVSRNPALADELRILVRRYRRDPQYGFSIEEAMRMCLVASAARKDLIEWREFAGQCLTELAFGELEGNEGKDLHSHLLVLLNTVPELWVTCAKAEAALNAYCTR